MSKLYLSRNFSCAPSFSVKMLLVKLKKLYIEHAWYLIMEKKKINKDEKDEKVGFVNYLLTVQYMLYKNLR